MSIIAFATKNNPPPCDRRKAAVKTPKVLSFTDAQAAKEEQKSGGWEINEVICLHCLHRWVSVHPYKGKWMKDWECPKCGKTGGIIRTGQPLD